MDISEEKLPNQIMLTVLWTKTFSLETIYTQIKRYELKIIFLRASFYFKKLELIQWIMLILGKPKFLSDSLGMLVDFGWMLNFIAQTHVKNKISIFGSQEIGSVLQYHFKWFLKKKFITSLDST